MAEARAGSTVPRRQLGRYLRELRSEAGLTVRAASKQLERSEPTLWRIEAGLVAVRSVEVDIMCRLYGAGDELAKALMALAKETKAKGWWAAYGDVVPEWFDLFVGLEAAATRMCQYEHSLVPGLFHTEAYAQTLIEAEHPGESREETARRLSLRMARQAILRRPIDPPVIRVALREAVLRSPVGGPEVMAEQLRHLAELADLPNISIRVIPAEIGYHQGLSTGAFTVLRFPPNGGGRDSEPPTIYQEMYTGALYLDKPDEVDRFDAAFEAIWDVSLDERASRDLITHIAEEMNHG